MASPVVLWTGDLLGGASWGEPSCIGHVTQLEPALKISEDSLLPASEVGSQTVDQGQFSLLLTLLS